MSAAKSHVWEMGRFVLVGGSAVVVDFLVYFALSGVGHVAPMPAKATSFVAGAALAFALNRGFVFRTEAEASRQIVPFAVLYFLSLLLNGGVNSLLLSVGVAKSVAWLLATGSSTVSNFVGMKFVVFRAGNVTR